MMRKAKRFFLIVLCIFTVAFALLACSDHGAPTYAVDPKYAITEESALNNLTEFVTGREDRTTFGAKEKEAADYLNNKMLAMGYETFVQDFVVTENDVSNLPSQNVVARLVAKNSDKKTKNVIIGAYYDNRFSSPYNGAKGDGSHGALNGATGVAALLSVAQYLAANKAELDLKFDVTFVFFGASYYSSAGARSFLTKMREDNKEIYADGKTNNDIINNTVLMVEMQRLGCDHVYAFSDARETRREGLFDRVARENGLDIYKITSKSPVITTPSTLIGIPYYQWAHNGVFGAFFNEGIPTLNLVGANWESADLSNAESKDNPNVSFTKNDNLETLLRLYPDCGKKIAQACTLVVKSLADEEFLEVTEYDIANFPEETSLSKQWIWYLVVLGIILLVGVGMFAVTSHIGKKYPVQQPAPIKMKMAVFGMDYEDKQSGDIFLDLRDPFAVDDEIFPGIENNAPHNAGNGMDDIFPPHHEPPQNNGQDNDDVFPPHDDGGDDKKDGE